ALFVRLEAKPGKENGSREIFARWAGFGATRACNNRLVRDQIWPDHLRDLRCVSRRSRTRRALVRKNCQGVDGKSARSPGRAPEDREGRRVGGQIAGLRSSPGACGNNSSEAVREQFA